MAIAYPPTRQARIIAPMRRGARLLPSQCSPGAPVSSTCTSGRRSLVHVLSLFAVWLTIATSGVVFAEPAPVDALTMGLVILLPTIGLVAILSPLVWFLAAWLIVAACGFFASAVAPDVHASTVFTAVSLYLYLAAFVFAAFAAKSPVSHTTLILNAWSVAAIVAATAALVGYFDLLPGASALFTKFGRAAGTFKDPNVFGPFLVAPILYMLHLMATRPLTRAVLPMIAAGILALALLLSFSRGAWVNLSVAVIVFGVLAFALSASLGKRARIGALMMAGLALIAGVVVVAIQFDATADLLSERAKLTQSYDQGPEGRFGGQAKAVDLIVQNPIGLGGQAFAGTHHHEEPHNVFLNMFLNAGWLGGILYIVLVGSTLVLGARHLLLATETRPLFLVIYASFLATVLQGSLIDTDHWRHFYLLMGVAWGLMAATWHERRPVAAPGRSARQPSRSSRLAR